MLFVLTGKMNRDGATDTLTKHNDFTPVNVRIFQQVIQRSLPQINVDE